MSKSASACGLQRADGGRGQPDEGAGQHPERSPEARVRSEGEEEAPEADAGSDF